MPVETYISRFVPEGNSSLIDDAPGWQDDQGPTCWKCKGSGKIKAKKMKKAKSEDREKSVQIETKECPICSGKGSLLKRLVPEKPGVITRGRKRPPTWQPKGPMPAAIADDTSNWAKNVTKANTDYVDVTFDDSSLPQPDWIPGMGEELCNLVGSWRILQRVGSHRWTTDDLVTACVASKSLPEGEQTQSIKYLDLGTGNASVLQMVTWALLKDGHTVDAIGVEARSEAVKLARRSLQFNLGSTSPCAKIAHADFRTAELEEHFDLVTGTPPYFRVDFSLSKDQIVDKAVINQGGMPTAKQSAPARCEFRGGIEAYCQAAARLMKATGVFVVCENWLNHDRVIKAALSSGLHIHRQVQVRGRDQKDVLFAVYEMKCSPIVTCQTENLAVRSLSGEWTKEYKSRVLDEMAIPYPNEC